MLNITLFSLNVLSSFATSPFYTIHDSHKRYLQSSFYNSHFSHSFTPYIITYTTNHRTIIKNSIFSFTLDSSLKFSNLQSTITIGGKTYTGSMYESDSDDHRPYFVDGSSDLIITGCIFDHCYAKNQGGSIIILQDCSATIHNTIFNYSYTESITGGAIFAAKTISEDHENFENEQIQKIDIQYCCFQNCYGTSSLYGVAIFSAAKENILFYASTVNCPGLTGTQTAGAQFDLQAETVTSKQVNCTGGNSNFCGGIEYRHAKNGFFLFQTISHMKCMFAVSYTDITDYNIESEMCNIMNVELRRGKINDQLVYSGLIHVRKTHSFHISKFAFIENTMNDELFIKDEQKYTDIKTIISRGTEGGTIEYIDITLSDCFFDCETDKIIYNTNVNIQTNDCHFNSNKENLINIEQLDLGECKGTVKAAPLTPTPYFSESFDFTDSNEFSETQKFSENF